MKFTLGLIFLLGTFSSFFGVFTRFFFYYKISSHSNLDLKVLGLWYFFLHYLELSQIFFGGTAEYQSGKSQYLENSPFMKFCLNAKLVLTYFQRNPLFHKVPVIETAKCHLLEKNFLKSKPLYNNLIKCNFLFKLPSKAI